MRYEDTMAGLQVPMMGFEQAAQKSRPSVRLCRFKHCKRPAAQLF
jgi:hypothetical protein